MEALVSLFNPFPVGFVLKLKLGKKQVVLVNAAREYENSIQTFAE